MEKFIDITAVIKDSVIPDDEIKIYKNAVIVKSKLGEQVSVGNDTNIVNSYLHDNVIINRRNFVNDTEIGNFSYTGINTIINFSKIGKFCSIARNVDIGGFNHDYDKVTTMPVFRLNNLLGGEVAPSEDTYCIIGNDVWIAAGVNILHSATIGDGAIIGAGAVVTKNVEPYSIYGGVPARKIKQRFSDEIIADLLEIKWWNWTFKIIEQNKNLMFYSQVTTEVIKKMREISL